jgi:hypothetical protein
MGEVFEFPAGRRVASDEIDDPFEISCPNCEGLNWRLETDREDWWDSRFLISRCGHCGFCMAVVDSREEIILTLEDE